MREREHLCHCYACCLVTTFFTVQRAEAMHEESLPLRRERERERERKRRKKKTNSIFHGGVFFFFEDGIFCSGSISSVCISTQTGVDNEINLKSAARSQFCGRNFKTTRLTCL